MNTNSIVQQTSERHSEIVALLALPKERLACGYVSQRNARVLASWFKSYLMSSRAQDVAVTCEKVSTPLVEAPEEMLLIEFEFSDYSLRWFVSEPEVERFFQARYSNGSLLRPMQKLATLGADLCIAGGMGEAGFCRLRIPERLELHQVLQEAGEWYRLVVPAALSPWQVHVVPRVFDGLPISLPAVNAQKAPSTLRLGLAIAVTCANPIPRRIPLEGAQAPMLLHAPGEIQQILLSLGYREVRQSSVALGVSTTNTRSGEIMKVSLHIRLGSLCLGLEEIAQLQAGQPLEVVWQAETLVGLFFGEEHIAQGQLISEQGKLYFQVVETDGVLPAPILEMSGQMPCENLCSSPSTLCAEGQ